MGSWRGVYTQRIIEDPVILDRIVWPQNDERITRHQGRETTAKDLYPSGQASDHVTCDVTLYPADANCMDIGGL
jgi:hypothetical protein